MHGSMISSPMRVGMDFLTDASTLGRFFACGPDHFGGNRVIASEGRIRIES
jgi:hypothetical protein